MPAPNPVKLVAVLAGTRRQFVFWVEELGISDRAFYVSKPEHILGRTFVGILKIGHWWETPNWRELEESIIARIQQ